MINSKDISVVVQGLVNKTETRKCLNSIRKYLPDAEIILSTWENSDTQNLDYDILILNKDPGAVPIDTICNKIIFNNMNRQLLSTKEGLKRCSRKYALKLRSDFILSDNKFLSFFDKFPKRDKEYSLFSNKIITSCLVTRFKIKYDKQHISIPFHISDWWFFGLKTDLDKYFADTELAKEPDFSEYFKLECNKDKDNPYGEVKFRFAPEQYFAYECYRRNFYNIEMKDASDVNDEIIEESKKFIINNFVILEYKNSGIYTNKYKWSKNEIFYGEQYIGLYNLQRFESEYKKYCDNEYKLSKRSAVLINSDVDYSLARLLKHIYRLSAPQSNIFERLEQLIIGIPFSLVSFVVILIMKTLKYKYYGDFNIYEK